MGSKWTRHNGQQDQVEKQKQELIEKWNQMTALRFQTGRGEASEIHSLPSELSTTRSTWLLYSTKAAQTTIYMKRSHSRKNTYLHERPSDVQVAEGQPVIVRVNGLRKLLFLWLLHLGSKKG